MRGCGGGGGTRGRAVLPARGSEKANQLEQLGNPDAVSAILGLQTSYPNSQMEARFPDWTQLNNHLVL